MTDIESCLQISDRRCTFDLYLNEGFYFIFFFLKKNQSKCWNCVCRTYWTPSQYIYYPWFYPQPVFFRSLFHNVQFELIFCRFPLCRWRRSSTRAKSAAGSQQLSHINSANYPGNSGTHTDLTVWCYRTQSSRRGSGWRCFLEHLPLPGCWSSTWNDTASTRSCPWTANWASK